MNCQLKPYDCRPGSKRGHDYATRRLSSGTVFCLY